MTEKRESTVRKHPICILLTRGVSDKYSTMFPRSLQKQAYFVENLCVSGGKKKKKTETSLPGQRNMLLYYDIFYLLF